MHLFWLSPAVPVCIILCAWHVLENFTIYVLSFQVEAGGVVTDPRVHAEVLQVVTSGIQGAGYQLKDTIESPLKGSASGNTEFLAYFTKQ